MRLTTVTVQRFRNFVEPQRIEVEDDVTCLALLWRDPTSGVRSMGTMPNAARLGEHPGHVWWASGPAILKGAKVVLVGKNESGKTRILQALHRLRPANGSRTRFDLTTEYPRWRLARDRRRNDAIGATHPIEAEFALEESDLSAMAEIFGVALPSSTICRAWRTYGDHFGVHLSCNRVDVIQAAAEDVQITADDLDHLLEAEDYSGLRDP